MLAQAQQHIALWVSEIQRLNNELAIAHQELTQVNHTLYQAQGSLAATQSVAAIAASNIYMRHNSHLAAQTAQATHMMVVKLQTTCLALTNHIATLNDHLHSATLEHARYHKASQIFAQRVEAAAHEQKILSKTVAMSEAPDSKVAQVNADSAKEEAESIKNSAMEARGEASKAQSEADKAAHEASKAQSDTTKQLMGYAARAKAIAAKTAFTYAHAVNTASQAAHTAFLDATAYAANINDSTAHIASQAIVAREDACSAAHKTYLDFINAKAVAARAYAVAKGETANSPIATHEAKRAYQKFLREAEFAEQEANQANADAKAAAEAQAVAMAKAAAEAQAVAMAKAAAEAQAAAMAKAAAETQATATVNPETEPTNVLPAPAFDAFDIDSLPMPDLSSFDAADAKAAAEAATKKAAKSKRLAEAKAKAAADKAEAEAKAKSDAKAKAAADKAKKDAQAEATKKAAASKAEADAEKAAEAKAKAASDKAEADAKKAAKKAADAQKAAEEERLLSDAFEAAQKKKLHINDAKQKTTQTASTTCATASVSEIIKQNPPDSIGKLSLPALEAFLSGIKLLFSSEEAPLLARTTQFIATIGAKKEEFTNLKQSASPSVLIAHQKKMNAEISEMEQMLNTMRSKDMLFKEYVSSCMKVYHDLHTPTTAAAAAAAASTPSSEPDDDGVESNAFAPTLLPLTDTESTPSILGEL